MAEDPHQEEREEMEYYYANHPNKKPSAYDKIILAGKQAVGAGKAVAKGAYDAGAAANQTLAKQGQSAAVQQMNRQKGFHQYTGQAAPRSATSRADYNGAPVDPNSTMHPGNHIYVIQGTMVSSKNLGPKKPREPRSQPWQRGGLGGNDPGF